MATISNSGQGKWEEEDDEEEEEEEEEALSLCDLPITLINDKDQDQDQSRREDSHFNETSDEEFDFRSWGGLLFKEPEMCAADDVFFQGQILPLRQSFNSEAPLITKHDGKQFTRSQSRSEYLDHVSQSESHSDSSRSSSVRRQNSSSSTSSNNTATNTTTPPRVSKPKIRYQFDTHPSPKPQLRASGPRASISGNQSRKSSPWEFFRLGVVPTPEIGLQDLKIRSSTNKSCVSRNSSSSSNNSASNANNKSINMSNKTHHRGGKGNHHHGFKQFVGKGGGLFMSGCKCSVDTVSSDTLMIKGGTKRANKTESTTHAVKEKVVDLKMKEKKKQRQKQGKKVLSRRRTFEWLKELHANTSHSDEEALLSNP